MKRFAVIGMLALVLAGCGGSKQSGSYSLAATEKCVKANLPNATIVGVGEDFVASTATGGAFRLHLASNEVTVLFGAGPEEANNLADAYRRFRARNVGIEDILRTSDNAVLLWQLHPTDGDANAVAACLK